MDENRGFWKRLRHGIECQWMRMLPSTLFLNIIIIIIVFIWTGLNDSKTQRKDTDSFANGEKNPSFQRTFIIQAKDIVVSR